MNAVQAVSAILVAYRPHFADADYTPVCRWLDEGCDLERDILPVIREWIARKPDIRSLGFFTRHVLAKAACPRIKQFDNRTRPRYGAAQTARRLT